MKEKEANTADMASLVSRYGVEKKKKKKENGGVFKRGVFWQRHVINIWASCRKTSSASQYGVLIYVSQ
jgi:homoserine trans-succinylase